jgi:AraC-like DNA-binding protein
MVICQKHFVSFTNCDARSEIPQEPIKSKIRLKIVGNGKEQIDLPSRNSAMIQQKYFIKNMVCPRCIQSVQVILTGFGLNALEVNLGQIILSRALTAGEKQALSTSLTEIGLELLDDRNTQLINQIKSIIINEIHYQEESALHNLSTILSEKLHYDYPYLSRLFSSVEGRTIEKFVLSQKTEKVKELLTYNELTLSEIAFRMHYSSTAHLSSQFRKVTGMSPSEFKKLQHQKRKSLDAL